MAEVSTVVQQPPEFIEAAAKPYITQLQKDVGGLRTADLSKVYGPQFTAGLGALTQQAIGKVGGLGAFEPYIQGAAQAQQASAVNTNSLLANIAGMSSAFSFTPTGGINPPVSLRSNSVTPAGF